MRNLLLSFIILLLAAGSRPALAAGPSTTTIYIKIDQFGYQANSQKVAVISDPQVGYNAGESFAPSTGANQYQVRRWDDDAVVFTGTITAHKNGATHLQSGDRGWWFDFSSVTAPGSYYVFDVGNAVGSYRFDIAENVYDEVLKLAVRTFYYQRVGFAKTAPYAGANWTDAASHTQDSRATDLSGNNPKDLSGGWYDAGDYNKYTTFTADAVPVLLEAYRANPAAFRDNTNIPESGNGVPDLLDEVKWELDWLKRMQDATGNGGFFLKVGAIDNNEATPPSTDARPRYYYGECTSATITGALDFAVAALVYKGVAAYAQYGNDLQARALQAWARANTATAGFTSFQTNCDNGAIKAGDADIPQTSDQPLQLQRAVAAAVYLFELTGDATYQRFVDANYAGFEPCKNTYWSANQAFASTALLRYSQLAGATATVKASILANLQTDYADGDFGRGAWTNNTDLYRAPMPDYAYFWGSNSVKAAAGLLNLDKARYLGGANAAAHTAIAESFVHYLHGVNPQGMVYLSNMDSFGAERSANEFYHTWFSNGSVWDNAKTSAKGPAPGYLTGGPNYSYVAQGDGDPRISPPAGQPHQKAYKDWNTNWNGSSGEASYSITENAIYYQAKYISLLSRLVARTPGTPLSVHYTSFEARALGPGTAELRWQTARETDNAGFGVEASVDGQHFWQLATVAPAAGANTARAQAYRYVDATAAGAVGRYYRLRQIDLRGGGSTYSPVQLVRFGPGELAGPGGALAISVVPNPAGAGGAVALVQAPEPGRAQLRVRDALGRVCWQTEQAVPVGASPCPLVLNGLRPGVYLLEVRLNGQTGRQRLVRE
jgi:hypothetical protein